MNGLGTGATVTLTPQTSTTAIIWLNTTSGNFETDQRSILTITPGNKQFPRLKAVQE